MKRKIALMAVPILPALLLALSALAPAAAAGPKAVASPSARPPLPVPVSVVEDCPTRVFDNLAHLVVFKCPDGALAFYRMDSGAGNFHSWLVYNGWAKALPGKVALNKTDTAGYQVLFGRASQEDVDALKLTARTPAGQNGAWYHVILNGPGGTSVTDAYFFVQY